MINDAPLGDPPAVVNDAQVGDQPAPPEVSLAVAEQASERTAQEGWATEDAAAAPESAPVTPEEQQADDDAEAQGRAAATAGQERASNPFDGRTAQGRAWARGYDSVSG